MYCNRQLIEEVDAKEILPLQKVLVMVVNISMFCFVYRDNSITLSVFKILNK